MKLSILIPTYNQDCSQLVKDLAAQCKQSGIEYEILVMDDGSTDPVTIKANQQLMDMLSSENSAGVRLTSQSLPKYSTDVQESVMPTA